MAALDGAGRRGSCGVGWSATPNSPLEERVRELERLLGRKTLEVEITQGGSRQGAGKKTELAARVAAEGRFPMKTVADVLGVARSHLHERVHRPAPPRGHFCKADEELLPLIRRVVDQRLWLSPRHRAGEQSDRRGQAGSQP